MTSFDVVFSPRSERHLASIYRQIAATSGRIRAEDAVVGLRDACLSLERFPLRGIARQDVGRGVRMISHRRWAAIFYTVSADTVTIAAIFARGRDAGTAFGGAR